MFKVRTHNLIASTPASLFSETKNKQAFAEITGNSATGINRNLRFAKYLYCIKSYSVEFFLQIFLPPDKPSQKRLNVLVFESR